ncbi:MAG TPA: monovalent cation:proton antiporter-2 (CPA2) family protein [Acetobacteraceae bacterium]|nr:monovalent cation:proton antiporter-2 (CPA2) family protein [Acetobacteraceae bacterium]
MLETLVALLGATAIAVPISRWLGFGSILGYLVAGVIIGPAGLRLVTNVEQIAEVAALGVIMLLFLIGLDLRPHRLWILRRVVFGLGLGQMVPSALVLAGLIHLAGVAWGGAAVLGAGLALSSTAIVLPMLAERNLLGSTAGRDGFAVLLFQDMAFIPLAALLPLLSGADLPSHLPWMEVARGVAVIAVILIGGSVLVRPLFRVVGLTKTPEVFTATALLLVVGTAALANWAGLSMSLGAFMAGVMVSDSEYRHELQADIEPFKGLLLGFFFMSVGMSANLDLAARFPAIVAAAVALLVAVKIAVAFPLGLIRRKSAASAARFGLALAEGSEFSFVLFGAAVASGALTRAQADLATLVIALSMAVTPVLFAVSERLLIPRLEPRKEPPATDQIDEPPAPVIICGFGRVGQVVGRVLTMQRIPFTALDKDAAHVEVVRRFGNKVYFGNPARVEVMRAAGAETARVLVIALDDLDETRMVAEMAKRHFRHLTIYARARNRRHAHSLMGIGIAGIVRETFFSSLRLTEMVLETLDVPPDSARRAIELFREHDERTMFATYAIASDEVRLIQSTQQAAEELKALFEADREKQPGDAGEAE